MSLKDIFKKKEKKETKEKATKAERASKETKETKETKEVKATRETGAAKEMFVPKKQKSDKISGEMGWVFRSPQISEKAGFLTEKNQYIFKVSARANKTDVKKAAEGIFGVNVDSVRIINVPGKERRVGRTVGFKKGYKKAIVKIKEGQKIEVLLR